MRPIIFASALVAALAISATAHATPLTTMYFSVSVTGGPTISFNLDSSEIDIEAAGEFTLYNLISSDPDLFDVVFYNPTWAESVAAGPLDFGLAGAPGTSFFFEGPQLYTGDESNPIFIPGTYDLVSDPLANTDTNYTGTAHLVISQTPIPEPSSMLLLGTGVLGYVGAVRRRFMKA